jgi:hypothetical protein
MSDLLEEIIRMAGVPGAIAATAITLATCYKSWLAAQRVRIRLETIEIEAPGVEAAVAILGECKRSCDAPPRTQHLVKSKVNAGATGG